MASTWQVGPFVSALETISLPPKALPIFSRDFLAETNSIKAPLSPVLVAAGLRPRTSTERVAETVKRQVVPVL
jgi:hypothetical protein